MRNIYKALDQTWKHFSDCFGAVEEKDYDDIISLANMAYDKGMADGIRFAKETAKD